MLSWLTRWRHAGARSPGRGDGAPARAAGGQSLHRQLLIWLLLPQLVLWIGGAFVTYNLAARYANAAVDATLSQATRSLARQVKPIGNGLFIDFPRAAQDILEADPNDRVLYTVSSPPGEFILGNRNLPPPRGIPAQPALGEPYFYNGEIAATSGGGNERVRVAALYLSYGDESEPMQTMLVQVARNSANREELARRILVDTVLPLSALIVLMTMIVWAGIRAGLAPLARLRSLVEGKAPNDLTAIELHSAPSEVRALAQAINDLLGAVQHNVVSQKRFISDAAHQLRTPLAGLKSQTELALKDAQDPALQARLQRVHESATRSAHLVNQLLTLARAEPESATVQARTRVDLARLARELTAELVPRARHAGIDLGYEPGHDGSAGDEAAEPAVEVLGIPLLLREALANVLDNALRYAGRGSEVTVRVAAEHQQALIEVRDTGPGIPAALHADVFERFVRGTHEGNGCGLGLAIVKEIVERHAGHVELADTAPHGLTTRILLPLAERPLRNLARGG
ncbi:sensor histidine kinase [Ideonella sp.]|uniref:sensor histidine kinase n=1 Tax=Ideonella sp. TaxID=1929293 RepID=UPI0035B28EA3